MPKGKAFITIDVQGVVENDVEDCLINYPVLLGHSFTERPTIHIIKTPSELQFQRVIPRDESKVILKTSSALCIEKGETKLIPVKSDSAFTGNIYVDGSVRGKIGSEYYLLPGESISKHQKTSKEKFDKNGKQSTKYKIGDLVRIIRAIASGTGQSKKLESKCQGPYRIKKILPNDRFVVEDTPLTRKGRRFESVVSIDKIFPWLSYNVVVVDS